MCGARWPSYFKSDIYHHEASYKSQVQGDFQDVGSTTPAEKDAINGDWKLGEWRNGVPAQLELEALFTAQQKVAKDDI